MNSPPLGLIELGTYLEKNKINVQLLDFFSLVRRYNEKECIISDKKINLSFDKKIVSNYLFKDKNHKKISKQVNLLLNLIKHKNYSSIVFSISYHSQILSSFILAKELKKIANVKIIFGGQVISNFGLLLFNKFPFIDFIIKGDGKISLVQLLKNKNKKNYAKIGGLIYRKNNKIVENKIKSYKNIEFFHPKYDLLDLSLYYDEHKKLTIPYQISNLCPFNCSFCSYHVNNCLISKPFSIMIKDLKLIINKYNTNDIFFLDSTLNVSLKFLNEFCDSIIQNGVRIKWKALISISNLNVEVISKMKLAGCRFLFIGIESFSELTLKKMNKNIKINKVGRIIRACNKNKIKIIISLIAGFPNENI
ncbi:B12-binding domain-containing radical SAM protein, partial [Candidatus Woesearchaeota archaeon]|nr:B12-binding domain-containing radical SAM protein [Candidatus Woesearchaeota archaeon]